MPTQLPPAQVCPLCGHDDVVSIVPGGDSENWLYVCTGTTHKDPYNWTVAIPSAFAGGREGVTAELGLYDDLLRCVRAEDPWVEHGIVEYRYSRLNPKVYLGELIPRFGHRAQGPRHFSASALIAKALGQLRNEGLLAWRYGKATGFWAYNGTISYWAIVPPPPDENRLTWEEFAENGGLAPQEWDLTSPE
jgi:hypothetical protein